MLQGQAVDSTTPTDMEVSSLDRMHVRTMIPAIEIRTISPNINGQLLYGVLAEGYHLSRSGDFIKDIRHRAFPSVQHATCSAL